MTVAVKFRRSLAVLGVVSMLAGGCGDGGPTMQGSALLLRVRAAYRHVPAVRVTYALGKGQASWTFLLRRDVITSTLYALRGPGVVPDLLLVPPNGRLYVFHQNAKCWDPDPRLSTDLYYDFGSRFPEIPAQGETARLSGGQWRLPFIEPQTDGRTDTLVVDAKTLVVERRVSGPPGQSVWPYKALKRAPRLPTPRPLCQK